MTAAGAPVAQALRSLRWARRDPHLPHLRVGRFTFAAGAGTGWHGHDFAEWFWVERGVLLHAHAGGRETLQRGAAMFLVPGAVHDLTASEPSTLVTASLPGADFRSLRRRHGASAAWPWPDHGCARVALSAAQLAALAALVDEMPDAGQERCDQEWFVARVLQLLRPAVRGAPAAPAWLTGAVDALAGSPRCAGGVPALIAACGHSAVHVNRMVRRTYGISATALMLRLRIERAAHQLRRSDRALLAIANDHGFSTLGHFYRHFTARYGMPPAAYRRQGGH
jgi:AraC family cel operon transcriptional repressor